MSLDILLWASAECARWTQQAARLARLEDYAPESMERYEALLKAGHGLRAELLDRSIDLVTRSREIQQRQEDAARLDAYLPEIRVVVTQSGWSVWDRAGHYAAGEETGREGFRAALAAADRMQHAVATTAAEGR